MLARDIIVDEPAFPWSDGGGTCPYAFTVAMFFAPDSGLEVEMMDISTVFTTPANYIPFVQGIAVYRRDRWDTPMDEIRTVGLDDMAELRTLLEERSAALYQRIAAMSKRERIESGAMVYTAGFALPFARAAGMYDELVAEHDFLEMHPAVSACYETIISGVATEMIPRLFLTGSWGNPVPEHGLGRALGRRRRAAGAARAEGARVRRRGRGGGELRARRGDRAGDAGGGHRARAREAPRGPRSPATR